MKIHLAFVAICVLLSLPALNAAGTSSPASPSPESDARGRLARAKTPSDSLVALYDLFDLSDRSSRNALAWQIYGVATRAADLNARADMLRQLAVLNTRNDSVMSRLVALASALPAGNVRDRALLFVTLQQTSGNTLYLSEEARQGKIRTLIAERERIARSGKRLSFYDDLRQLYQLVIYLGSCSQGPMYEEYLDSLGLLIDRLPEDHLSIRNQFYTQQAILYTMQAEPAKAIQADRKLLVSMDKLAERYRKAGRLHRNYTDNRYNCYRRMLSNYQGLSIQEVDSIYAIIGQLATQSADVASDIEKTMRPEIYYDMAHKRYAQAIPLLNKSLKYEHSNSVRFQLLTMLREAAAATGDDASLLRALRELNTILEERNRNNTGQAYRELQIRYDVDRLNRKASDLELDRVREGMTMRNRLISISLVALFAVALILLIVHRRLNTQRARNRELEQELERLRGPHRADD